MNQDINDFAVQVGKRNYRTAVIHLYAVVQTITGQAESIVSLNKHADALATAWHKSNRVGISSFSIPMTNSVGRILISFEKHGNGSDNPTALITVSEDCPPALRAAWVNNVGTTKVTIPIDSGMFSKNFLLINGSILIGFICAALLSLGVSLQYRPLVALLILAVSYLVFSKNRWRIRLSALTIALAELFINFGVYREFHPVVYFVLSIILAFAEIIALVSLDDITVTRPRELQLPPSPPQLILQCPRCGTTLTGTEEFCIGCGANLIDGPYHGPTKALVPDSKKRTKS